jgi:hypothetical protein
MDNLRVSRIAMDEVFKAMRLIWTLIMLGGVEGVARILGTWDYYVKGRKHEVWDIAWTTKRVEHTAESSKPKSNVN